MIHLRTIVSLVALLFALGAAACGTEGDTENGADLNANSSAVLKDDNFTCKPPRATTIGFACPQAGCCLQKRNYTSPPSYFCYDCR